MKKILILGGANLHCKLVKAAKEMGLYTIVTDYIENSPAKIMADKSYMLDIKDVDGIVKMCKEEKIDAVISTHLDPCQRYYYQICKELNLPCYIGNWEQVFTLTDKDAFKACCQKYGVDVIPTYEMNDNIEYPVLVKPAHSRGSRGQTVCYGAEELGRAIEFAESESDNKKAIIEKYMGNTGEFTMTYIFKDGVPYMTKTSDRYLGAIEHGLEKVGIGTVSPSQYTSLYINNVEECFLNMLKGLGIKNGPVFMQGFVDGNTVRFFDPGYRFPGSEYDTMFEKIWNIDIMKMMVNFALTGEITSEFGELRKDLALLKGKSVITLFPVIREGKIKEIRGLDKLDKMNEVVCYTIRHNEGETVGFTGNVNQRVAEVDIIAESVEALKVAIDNVLNTLEVIDENGENMLFGNIDTTKIKEVG
ncbi:MAG: hypothetical protein E7393_03270 [Ruminococcaceae bacterium]|nr:hypothetical protein [Oscillospiraceae bacterium]